MRRAFFLIVMTVFPSLALAAEQGGCTPQPGRAAHFVSGEVAGADVFREELGNGWMFALIPAAHGWDVRLFDANGADLTRYTTPYRFVSNPREIYGWHFRNADNTGTNEGSVNAPGTLRRFVILPELVANDVDPMAVDIPIPEVLAEQGEGF